MIKVMFIRHGETKGNLEKRYIGITDESLCQKGIETITKVKEKNIKPDYLFVSPLKRTMETAKILFPDIKPIITPNFREMDFGDFENKNASELSGNIEFQKWVDAYCGTDVPNGERLSDFSNRCVFGFLDIIKDIPQNKTVAIVTHGGVIMAILAELGIPKKNFYEYQVANGECVYTNYEENKGLTIL